MLNDPDMPNYEFTYSNPDVTAVGLNLVKFVDSWEVTNDPPSLSDHLYIKFNLVFMADIVEICDNVKYNCRKTNWNVFNKVILNEIDSLFSLPTTDSEGIDKAVGWPPLLSPTLYDFFFSFVCYFDIFLSLFYGRYIEPCFPTSSLKNHLLFNLVNKIPCLVLTVARYRHET